MDKNKKIAWIVFLFSFILILTASSIICTPNDDKSVININETQNEWEINGEKKWRVGFCQSMGEAEGTGILYYTMMALEEKELLKGLKGYNFIPYEEDTENLWNYLCSKVESDYFIFSKEAFYDLESQSEDEVLKKLKNKEIDLMITYGTKAGKALFNDQHSVATINLGTNDPVSSGILVSDTDSGYDHLWAHVDPDRYYRQLRVFYDTVKFKKLGMIVYADSYRKTFSPIEEVETLARQLDFDVEIYNFYNVEEIFDKQGQQAYYKELMKAHEYLADNCDAFYMVIGGWEYKDLPELLNPFYDKKIPVFSQFGSIEVENGALMSMGKVNFSDIGSFAGNVICRILSGEKPNDINNIYREIQGLAFNMKVGKKIDFKPDISFLINCDEVYNN